MYIKKLFQYENCESNHPSTFRDTGFFYEQVINIVEKNPRSCALKLMIGHLRKNNFISIVYIECRFSELEFIYHVEFCK